MKKKIPRYNNSPPYVTAKWPSQQSPPLNFIGYTLFHCTLDEWMVPAFYRNYFFFNLFIYLFIYLFFVFIAVGPQSMIVVSQDQGSTYIHLQDAFKISHNKCPMLSKESQM